MVQGRIQQLEQVCRSQVINSINFGIMIILTSPQKFAQLPDKDKKKPVRIDLPKKDDNKKSSTRTDV